jgi:hypothetical protein
MARSAIPDFGTEYPEYVYRAWPKYVGLDEDGEAVTAENEEEYRRLKEIVAYPKVLGKDKHGNKIIAQNPRDEKWFASKVVHDAIESAEPSNALTGEGKRGPGRPPRVAA